MSDIRLEFGWEAILLITLMIGWPGLLLGGLAGGLAWRRHRWIGTLAGAVVGLGVWSGVQFAWG